MIIITLHREHCIGCNYCMEVAPSYFDMDEEDGKSILLHSEEKSGFHSHKTHDDSAFDECNYAAESCPVDIISVREN
ncbi:MAG: ferredoxin [Balneolaceae bacterium]|nr:ferredoxin [Balneolaceae bacterium]